MKQCDGVVRRLDWSGMSLLSSETRGVTVGQSLSTSFVSYDYGQDKV